MKKMIGLVSLVFVAALSACTSNTETLVVLTSSGYAPYEMVDTSGKLTGFDIELMEAIAEEMGLEIVWKDVDFDGIVASLQSGKAEIAIAGLTPTDERRELVDFSDYYYQLTSDVANVFLFAEGKEDILHLEDFTGLVIGAQIGTVQATYLESIKEEYGFTVDLRATNTMIVEEIKAGRIDALMVEEDIANSIIKMSTALHKVVIESNFDMDNGNAIAFAKGSNYVKEVNAALLVLKENGELDRLITKWFK